MKFNVLASVVLFIVVCLGICPAAESAAVQNPENEIVPLKPFKVFAEWIVVRPFIQQGRVAFVRIVSVTPNTPAAKAGIKDGDLLITMQGQSFRGLTELQMGETIDRITRGRVIELEIADPPRKGYDNRKSLRLVRLEANGIKGMPKTDQVSALSPKLPPGDQIAAVSSR